MCCESSDECSAYERQERGDCGGRWPECPSPHAVRRLSPQPGSSVCGWLRMALVCVSGVRSGRWWEWAEALLLLLLRLPQWSQPAAQTLRAADHKPYWRDAFVSEIRSRHSQRVEGDSSGSGGLKARSRECVKISSDAFDYGLEHGAMCIPMGIDAPSVSYVQHSSPLCRSAGCTDSSETVLSFARFAAMCGFSWTALDAIRDCPPAA